MRWLFLVTLLRPVALPGSYANLLGPDDREQAAGAYGDNASRLWVLKHRFDPDVAFAAGGRNLSGYV